MWILTPLYPGGKTNYLLASKEYVVGRKNCDIVLPNDQSISRAHAHLTATDQTLTLKDLSKYGTFVNSQRVTEHTPVNLKSGDYVTFGVFHSKFRYKPVVCSSCLNSDGKASLSQALLALGGKLVSTWTQDCTHLAMPSGKVTVKMISALLCCCPIMKPEFFSELNKAVQQKLPLPKAESFIPDIDEPCLSKEAVNLGAIPARKQLFTEKTFIFLSARQLKRLSAAVTFGGGRSQLLKEGSLPQELLESPQSCVVDVTTGSSQPLLPLSSTEWVNSVKNIVQRVITESEIGLAVIYASCDKYCNPSNLIPDSEFVPNWKPRIPSASLSPSMVVDETVLPAPSQNITAYAPNTEPSQGYRLAFCHASHINKVPAATSQTTLVSEDNLFTGLSSTAQEKPQSRKRKEMEAEIEMEELESIMSEDMDCIDEQLSGNRGQQAGLIMQSSAEQKPGLTTLEASSLSKRQRVHREENGSNQRPKDGLEKDQRQKPEQHVVSIKTEQVHPSQYRKTNQESSKLPPMSSASTSKNIQPFEDDEASYIEVRKEGLTSSRVPGAEGLLPIIGGSDLLVHNRGKNSNLDEWLKDAAEEEHQSRQEETIGDDLFRYNPTKLTKRR
uniref:Nibrin n=1 Tax=Monopterus albus TaxID=43700 RepID=A0A3Q3Q4A4_MONAL